MTKTLTIAAVLTILAGAASAQSSWSWTAENGASGGGTRDCTAADGERSCSATRSVTGAYGHTRSTEVDRVRSYGASSVSGTRTGRHGGTASFTRSWNR